MPTDRNRNREETGTEPYQATSGVDSLPGSIDDATWDLLSAYLDGELSQQEAAALQRRMGVDPLLAQELALLQGASLVLRAEGLVEPPPRLRTTILAKTTGRRTPIHRIREAAASFSRSLAPARRLALPAAAVIAIALLIPALRLSMRPTVPVGPGTVSPPQLADAGPSLSGPPAASLNSGPATHFQSSIQTGEPLADNSLRVDRPLDRPRHPAQTASANTHPARLLVQPAVYRPLPRASAEPRRRSTAPGNGGSIKAQGGPPMQLADASGYTSEPDMDTRFHQAKAMPMDDPRSDIGQPVDAVNTAPHLVPATDITPKPARQYGHLLLPETASTTADFRKEDMTKRLGFDRETLEGIKRHQVTVSLIGARF